MAIVARASLTRTALAACLTLALGACTATPSAAPSGPASSVSEPPASQTAACQGATVPAAAPLPRWANRVWYEIFVRSFQDSNGDGIGDLEGLTDRLDYLNDGDPATSTDLGITGIWLMPIAASPSYHGYDVTDYEAVEPDYGDRAALTTFLAEAHARGIDVIVDLVLNHTSSQHPWFQDALEGGPHHDWYVWSKEDPHWPPVAGPSPWHLASNGEWFYGAFWEGMPDLNLRNPDVTAEIDRISDFWLDDIGVDGFRIDAAKHLIEDDAQHQANTPETRAWLADFSRHVHEGHPDALIVDEVYDISRLAGEYVPDSADLTFDFGRAAASISALQNGRAAPMTTALAETLDSWSPNRQASFLTNHDQNRVMSQLNGDMPSARLAAFMLLTGPGVPFVYYGEELGMQGTKPDERIRTPMQWADDEPAGGFSTGTPWEPLADDWRLVNLETDDADPASLVGIYRQLIALRGAHPALAQGMTWPVDGGAESVIGWVRATSDELLLTLVNVGTRPVSDYGLSLAEGPLCGVTAGEILATVPADAEIGPPEAPTVTAAGGVDAYVPIRTIPPRSGIVIQLSRS